MEERNSNRKRLLWPCLFLGLEAALYLIFVISNACGRETPLFPLPVWQFAVVAAAFCYAAVRLALTKREHPLFCRRLWLVLAFALTVVSDVFLVLLQSHQLLAVCIFFAAQLFHALEIPRGKKQAEISFCLRFGATLVGLAALVFLQLLTPLYAAVAFYAPQLLGNLAEHTVGIFRAGNPTEKRRSLLLAVAFALFLACDVCVGLAEIGTPGVGYWIWIVYAPSQALLAVSCT